MRIGILQPGYLPWLGFFEQLHKADVFVIYDDVQYDKNGWRNRNRIKTASGPQWLTVPVMAGGKPLIKDVAVDNGHDWARKHLLSIRQNYSRAPFFADHIGAFEEAYARRWELLVDLDLHFIAVLARAMGLDTGKLVRSSSIAVQGDRIERIMRLCEHFKADVFYEGAAGKDYIDAERFAAKGIRVEFQDYQHPRYRQLFGDFVPHLSAADLLFNHGPESLDILTGAKNI